MHAHASSMEGSFPLPSARKETAASEEDTGADDASLLGEEESGAPSGETTAAVLPPSWTARLLAEDSEFQVARELGRFGVGLGLSALYGLSLGARQGGKAFFLHAAGVPAALLAVTALGIPALYIVLALFDAPIEPPKAIAAAARATAQSGLVLAGLARRRRSSWSPATSRGRRRSPA